MIPTKAELRAMLNDAKSPLWLRTFLAIAIYGGLRASEIRGLPWANVDLKAGVIRVCQRADFAGRYRSAQEQGRQPRRAHDADGAAPATGAVSGAGAPQRRLVFASSEAGHAP